MTETTRALSDQRAALELLLQLATRHPDLPAVYLTVSPRRNAFELAIHNDLPGFEAWREALDIAPEAVTRHTQSGDTTMVLTGVAHLNDLAVQLVGFAPNVAELHMMAVAA